MRSFNKDFNTQRFIHEKQKQTAPLPAQNNSGGGLKDNGNEISGSFSTGDNVQCVLLVASAHIPDPSEHGQLETIYLFWSFLPLVHIFSGLTTQLQLCKLTVPQPWSKGTCKEGCKSCAC